MIDIQLLAVAFMIGLGSTGHCMMMCGGISAALATSLDQGNSLQKAWRLICFHSGRILCYSLLGLLIGTLLTTGVGLPKPVIMTIRYLAAIMLILIGLYIAGFSNVLRLLESRLGFLWKRVQPLVQKLLPVRRWYHAILTGFFWGFLPCGIVYSTLLWAGTSTMSWTAALLMFSFGLGTIPGLLAMNLASQQLMQKLQQRFPKKALGIAMVLFGIWTLPAVMNLTMQHGDHGNHGDHSQHMQQMENTEEKAQSDIDHSQMHHHHHH